LLPFVTGILCEIAFGFNAPDFLWLVVLLVMLMLLAWLPRAQSVSKYVLLLCTDAFLILFGIQLTWHATAYNQPGYFGNYVTPERTQIYLVVVEDIPEQKPRSYKTSLRIEGVKQGDELKRVEGRLIAYFGKGARSEKLSAGDVLLLKARLQAINEPSNPMEFNYKTYLANRGIYYSAFIDTASFRETDALTLLHPLEKFANSAKTKLLSALRNSNLSPEAFGICSALLIGYDADVDRSVMDAFSHSGTLHVLSVSGLHTGLIYVVLDFLFGLIDRKKRYKLARFIFISVTLWAFALVTGFSAPVLRAVIMFNLFGLGKIYFRSDYRNQLNILLVSGFALLSYNPFYITEAGFLLSYTALAGIIYFQPRFQQMWQPDLYILNYTWQSITASVAATIATLPITLLYFKQFPLWFFVCNIVVVPLTFVLLLLAFILAVKLLPLAGIINLLVQFLIYFMNLFNAEGWGYIEGIDFNTIDALFLTALIVIAALLFETKKFRVALLSLLLLVCWQGYALIDSGSSKKLNAFTVYQVRGKNIYSLKNGTEVYLNRVDSTAHNFSVRPQLVSFNYPNIQERDYNMVETRRDTILVLSKSHRWPVSGIKGVTLLVIANNYELSEHELRQMPGLKTIVADGSNNTFIVNKTGELCRKFGLFFYNTKNLGAYQKDLQ
jgi:competence protein ComEC